MEKIPCAAIGNTDKTCFLYFAAPQQILMHEALQFFDLHERERKRMKATAKLSAGVLAGLMALSMTACGAASTHTAPRYAAGTYTYENGQLYRYSPAADNKGNVRQNVTNNAGTNLRNAGKDLGNAARDTTRAIGDAAKDTAGAAGRVLTGNNPNTRADSTMKRNTRSNTNTNNNTTTAQMPNNAGVSLTTGLR